MSKAALTSLSILLLGAPVQLSAQAWAAPAPEPVLQRIPHLAPRSTDDALKAFQIKKGFHLELAVAEPLVVDPIAMSFDENGRLFVVEMRDYPLHTQKPVGRIKLLVDSDGDGRFDRATVFADGLTWPTAVLWARGGVYVGTSPDLLFFKDTDGDGKADERKVLFTGFGGKDPDVNVQGLPNSFQWGLDNRIHGSAGTNGGEIVSVGGAGGKAVDLRGKDFSIEPRTLVMSAEDGGGQYGMTFDDWGRKFVCSNSHHIQAFPYHGRYAGLNPHHVLPTAMVDIPVDGASAEVYRLSPDEAWRVIRTRWRTAGIARGPLEGGGRVSGYFTAASGVTIYRGHAFGPQFVGDAFIADVAGNLVHRKKVRPAGPFVAAERPADEQKVEFLASPDNWFRPVGFANAPDGTLYVADMYREIIEHPVAVPESIKKQYNLYSGDDKGRIYRIVPDGWKRPAQVSLGTATTADLVRTLAHPNGWHRDTASRLLFERNDKAAVPLLIKLQQRSPSALGRLHALFALHGFGALTEALVLRALADRDPGVRMNAVRLSEKFLVGTVPPAALWARLSALGRDPAINVRHQLAQTLVLIDHPKKTDVLLAIIGRDGAFEWSRGAVLNALTSGAAEVFTKMAPGKGKAGAAFLPQLAALVGARNDAAEVARVAAFIGTTRDAPLAFALARALGDGLGQAGSSVARAGIDLGPMLAKARVSAGDAKAPISTRVRAAEVLGLAAYADAAPTLLPLLDAAQSEPVQLAALSTLDGFADPALAPALIERLAQLSPRTGAQALTALLRRPDRAIALLKSIEAGTVSRTVLSVVQVNVLRQSSDKPLNALAAKVLAVSASPRGAVLQKFAGALDLKGDGAHGRTLFEQRCVSCHRMGDLGHALGPDLVAAKAAGREALMNSILDPNREVPTQYMAYVIETKDGGMLVGVVGSETPATVTLRQAFGVETAVPRAQIKSMRSQGTSLMPEGMEEGIKPQDLADLIEFISTAENQVPSAKRL